mmetsp:Transcript_20374/g.30629  ORF Transcript_20374/g.30629 Transcript_20374/m.30629 type:complete len:653 (-) Transcript_20374:120-2078(-)
MSHEKRPSLFSKVSSRFLVQEEKKEGDGLSEKGPSLLSTVSSRFLGTDSEKTQDDGPTFLKEEGLGRDIAKIINENLDDIPGESLMKISNQLEYWFSLKELDAAIGDEELVDLSKRLVHAATWRSRLDDKNSFSIPKVRFGRTEIQMPIITCGGMRIQQSWMPDNIPLLSLNHKTVVASDSQKVLKDVIHCCIKLGLNHFETARFYGTSELQFVDALVSLMEEGSIERKDFIFQTKCIPSKTRKEFEKTLNYSWERVSKLEYIDLFAFHVVSKDNEVDWVLDDSSDGCMSVVKDFKSEGKIKHIGFSTHGTGETIMRMINSNKFDYVNIHCHYFGSYHAEGTPDTKGGHGNIACVKRALELDMGVFNISPFDKGGKLYKPSNLVTKAIGTKLTPISFASLHSWKTMGFHTVSVGLAKVSDLDEVIDAAFLYQEDKKVDEYLEKAENNLKNLAIERLGEEWYEKGLVNIPSCYRKSTNGVAIGHILWLHNVCTAFGMYDFARDRYGSLESTAWNNKKSFEENLDKMSGGNSGRALQEDVDLTEALKDHYDPDLAKSKLKEAHNWLTKTNEFLNDEKRKEKEWDEGYSLTTWVEFPGDVTASDFISKLLLQNLTGGYFGINNKIERKESFKKASSLRDSFRNYFSSAGKLCDNS